MQTPVSTTGINLASGLMEVGPQNFRLNGTVGLILDNANSQWLKFSGEFLTQRIQFSFFSGADQCWVQQGAIGLAYRYNINNTILPHADISAYRSHAPSHNLATISGSYLQDGTTINFSNQRRIAGSDASGGQIGFTTHFWPGGDLELAANYDHVVYDNKYEPQVVAEGAGGTAIFTQALSKDIRLALTGTLQAPYNFYKAELSWLRPSRFGQCTFNIFGQHVNGKKYLPDTSIIGLGVQLALDVSKASHHTANAAQSQTFNQWLTKPAVYMPQVLAIAEQQVIQTSNSCVAPQVIGTIPNKNLPIIDTSPFSTAEYFNSTSTITYSLIAISPLPSAYYNVTIDSSTGMVTVTDLGSSPNPSDSGIYQVRATTTGGCYSTSNQFTINYTPGL